MTHSASLLFPSSSSFVTTRTLPRCLWVQSFCYCLRGGVWLLAWDEGGTELWFPGSSEVAQSLHTQTSSPTFSQGRHVSVTDGWKQKVSKKGQEQNSLAPLPDLALLPCRAELCLANSKVLLMCLSEHDSGMKRDSGQTS